MQAAVAERAPAKLNLTLAVTGRRPDGYHELRSVMVPLQLADQVTVAPDASLSVGCSDPAVPGGAENLAYRAAAALRAEAGLPDAAARIWIEKQIPSAAGLAGGSADAAAVLRACNRLWGLNWPLARLARVAEQLGADVPFCLYGRPALAEGIGERLTPLPPPPPIPVVLAMPQVAWAGPKTATVFRAYRPGAAQPDTDGMAAAIRDGAPDRIAALAANALEPAAAALHPVIRELKAALLAAGAAGAALSGAGPTVFGLCTDLAAAERVAAAARAAGAAWVAVTALAGGEPA